MSASVDRRIAVDRASLRTAGAKRRALLEAGVSYVLIMTVIWTPRPAQRWLWWIAAASVVVCTMRSFDGVQAMGLRATNLLRSLWVVGAALVVAAIGCAVSAHFDSLKPQPSLLAFIATYFAYTIWAFAQQFLLQCFFLLRFLRVSSPRGAALAAAGVFAIAHLPNPVLAPITLIWGLAACLIFLRYRNLYPLAVAHAILGITVAMAVPGPVDHNMRVGWSYLTYSHRAHRQHRFN
jgi:membrane protease YdiL (CAAX protease family)